MDRRARTRDTVLINSREMSEPVFVNLLRSPGMNSSPGGIDSFESISEILKRLQMRALVEAKHSLGGWGEEG
jgi:hypothetical protein